MPRQRRKVIVTTSSAETVLKNLKPSVPVTVIEELVSRHREDTQHEFLIVFSDQDSELLVQFEKSDNRESKQTVLEPAQLTTSDKSQNGFFGG